MGQNMVGSQKITAKEIGDWMVDEYQRCGECLDRRSVAERIQRQFGGAHVYRGPTGELYVQSAVLNAFRKGRPSDAVFCWGNRAWRKRRPSDPPNSRMVRE
jgi:hypothetical protein